MAGIITQLQVQRRTQERVNVYLDGEYAFALPVLEAAKLHLGQQLSDEDIAGLRAVDAFQKAYDRALNYISFRPRSRAEVERNLVDAEVDADVLQAVIERLEQQGYIDDAAFARFWVENREQFRPRGPQALRHELRQKGIDSETVSAALEGTDPLAAAYRAGRDRATKLAQLAEDDIWAFRQKLSGFLLRRGFGYDVVRSVVARLEAEITGESRITDDE